MVFYWLLPGSQIPFPPGGLEIEHSVLSFSLTSIVFPLIALLLAICVCSESWLLACIQPDRQFDLRICLSKAVQLIPSQASLKHQGAQFSLCKVPKIGLFLKFMKVYVS